MNEHYTTINEHLVLEKMQALGYTKPKQQIFADLTCLAT